MQSHLLALCAIIAIAVPCAAAVRWECTDDGDCAAVPLATCSPSLRECRCPAGHTFAGNVTACIRESLNGESCHEDSQCAHMLTGSHCASNGVCECADGYTYVRGRCRQLAPLHGACDEDVDCFFGYDRESVVCAERKCQCTPDYYQRDVNICRRKSMNAGDPCVVHEDCVGEQLACNDFSLECEPISLDAASAAAAVASPPIQTTATQQQEITRNDNPNGRRDASTSTTEQRRKTVSFQQTQTPTRHEAENETAARFGDACAQPNGEQCAGLPHSECQHEQCRCRRGYYVGTGGVCMAEIGEAAAAAHLCSGDGLNAVTGRCYCRRNDYAMPHLRACIPPGYGIGQSCSQTSQCSPFGAAFCTDPNSPDRRVCTCHTYATYDPARQMCVLRQGLGARCVVKADCATQTTDSDCSPQQLCVCREHYVQTAVGTCAPGLDAECQTDAECSPENSACSAASGRCVCRPGFVGVGEQCLKEATIIEEECLEDEQCQPLLGERGKCIDSACKCEDHLQHTNGKCNRKRALDESCKASSECHVTIEPENVVCRNGACGCKLGMQKDTAKQVCRKNSSSKMSPLKFVTILLCTAAIGVTSTALYDAYF